MVTGNSAFPERGSDQPANPLFAPVGLEVISHIHEPQLFDIAENDIQGLVVIIGFRDACNPERIRKVQGEPLEWNVLDMIGTGRSESYESTEYDDWMPEDRKSVV